MAAHPREEIEVELPAVQVRSVAKEKEAKIRSRGMQMKVLAPRLGFRVHGAVSAVGLRGWGFCCGAYGLRRRALGLRLRGEVLAGCLSRASGLVFRDVALEGGGGEGGVVVVGVGSSVHVQQYRDTGARLGEGGMGERGRERGSWRGARQVEAATELARLSAILGCSHI